MDDMSDAKPAEVETSNTTTSKQTDNVDTKNVDVETADDKEDNNVKPTEDNLLCGMKRRTAYIAIAITILLLAIGITLAVIYGRPADWKKSSTYVQVDRLQMISLVMVLLWPFLRKGTMRIFVQFRSSRLHLQI